MTRKEANEILGNQPKWAMRCMCHALQTMSLTNDAEDWQRLRALRALGYKVTVEIPKTEEPGNRPPPTPNPPKRFSTPLKRALDACAVLDNEWADLAPDYKDQVRITVQRIIDKD